MKIWLSFLGLAWCQRLYSSSSISEKLAWPKAYSQSKSWSNVAFPRRCRCSDFAEQHLQLQICYEHSRGISVWRFKLVLINHYLITQNNVYRTNILIVSNLHKNSWKTVSPSMMVTHIMKSCERGWEHWTTNGKSTTKKAKRIDCRVSTRCKKGRTLNLYINQKYYSIGCFVFVTVLIPFPTHPQQSPNKKAVCSFTHLDGISHLWHTFLPLQLQTSEQD